MELKSLVNSNIAETQAKKSYWIESTEKTNYPKLEQDIEVDIAIVGGGIAGLTTAWLLKKDGMRVAVIEADKIVEGTTGHTTAKITSQHGLIYSKLIKKFGEEKARQYADANQSAIKMIENIVREKNIDCEFEKLPAYVFTQSDKYISKLEDETEAAKSLGIPASMRSSCNLPFNVSACMQFDSQAQFHPRKYLLALAGDIQGAGSQIFEKTRAVDVSEEGNVIVKIENGKKVYAKRLVIASHFPFYDGFGLYFTRLYTERSYIIALKFEGEFPKGMFINAETPTRSLRLAGPETSDSSSRLLLVGGEHHKTGQGENTIEHYKKLIDFSNENFNVTDIPYMWSTQDCMTMDGVPITGKLTSASDKIYVTTGYGKWGMTNSTASAMILRDLIVSGKCSWEDVYSSTRMTPVASAKNFVVENANVAGQLVGGKLEFVPGETDIAKGVAKTIGKSGNRIGAYRDNDDKFHVVDTTCTHLGCEVHWNEAEKTWDCPCHGSRFTIDGEIEHGPALKPLARHEIK